MALPNNMNDEGAEVTGYLSHSRMITPSNAMGVHYTCKQMVLSMDHGTLMDIRSPEAYLESGGPTHCNSALKEGYHIVYLHIPDATGAVQTSGSTPNMYGLQKVAIRAQDAERMLAAS